MMDEDGNGAASGTDRNILWKSDREEMMRKKKESAYRVQVKLKEDK